MGQGRAYGEPQVKTATAASDTVIRRNARFPRNGEFVGWEGDKSDPNAVSVQWWLRVPFGDRNDRQFDLCMYVRGWGMAEGNDCGTCQVAKVERENCGQWEVPQNWQPGQPLTYRGQKLQETRERLRFDSDGNPYDYYRYYQDWKSGGPDRNAEDADVVPAKATAPLGEEGISGAALSAMLDGLSARARKQVNLPQYRDAVAAAPLAPVPMRPNLPVFPRRAGAISPRTKITRIRALTVTRRRWAPIPAVTTRSPSAGMPTVPAAPRTSIAASSASG